MDKIVCAVEEWDSILDYYRPNGSSKTWYLKEEGKLQLPHMWDYWSILTEDGGMFDDVRDLITLPLGDNVIYTQNPKKISENYLYLLNIINPQFFKLNNETGFKCISKKYLNDIQSGICKLILIFPLEGYSGTPGNSDLELIQKWIDEVNLPATNVYYITGNLYADKLKNIKNLSYNIIPVSEFESWINFKKINLINTIDYSPRFKNDLLLSYNRVPRSHRLYFLVELLKNNLMDSSLISCSNIPDTYHNLPDNKDDEFLKKLKEITPIEIDTSLDYNLAHILNVKDHEETFISVVTETLVDKNTLFLSEKIWKPISIGHPFMVIGNKGTLEYLKSLGFKTYDKWVDESYDEMNEWEDRVDHIIQELVKFNKLSIFEKKQIRNEMFEICDFNKKYFINHCLNKYDYYDNFYMKSQNQLIYDIVYDIWKSTSTGSNIDIHTPPSDKKELHTFSVWDYKNIKNINNYLKNIKSTQVFISCMDEWELDPKFKDTIFISKLEKILIENDIKLHITFGSENTVDMFYEKLEQIPKFNTTYSFWASYWAYVVIDQFKDKKFDIKYNKNTLDKLFISLNNKLHYHRCVLMDKLSESELLKYGYISWIGGSHDDEYEWKSWKPTQLILDSIYPKTLDSYDNIPDQYFKSAINIIPESTVNVPFLTEKTFTAIYFEKPFIILGSKHIHKLLKDLGFELYDEIFNYEFDEFDDLNQRVDSIIDNLNKLKDIEYSTIYELVKEKTIKNKQHLFHIVNNKQCIPQELLNLHNKYESVSNKYNYLNYIK